jgi:hypothetical protein
MKIGKNNQHILNDQFICILKIVMKKSNILIQKSTRLIFIVVILLVSSCSHNERDTVWLKDLQNPFIGKWQARIPSMNHAVMVSEYNTDGTFTCQFPDLPTEQGGGKTYTGGYLVKDNVLITFLSGDGGIGGYTFKVVDNNTIDVTEIDKTKEDGSFESGNIVSFIRFSGSPVYKENKPLVLSNVLANGTWKETTTPRQMEYQFKTDGTGTIKYIADGQQLLSDIGYSTVHDAGINETVLILFVSKTNRFTVYSFAQSEDNHHHITLKEITAINRGEQGFTATYGNSVIFSPTQQN